jgi:hypothetical protein
VEKLKGVEEKVKKKVCGAKPTRNRKMLIGAKRK